VKKLKLHWWILLGVLLGIAVGTAIYLGHREAARVAVLGEGYEPRDVIARAADVRSELERQLEETGLYRALDGLAEIFLRLLRMIVIPLVFFSLVSGLAGLGGLRRLGRLGLSTFGLYLINGTLAILEGFILVTLIRPGDSARFEVPGGGQTPEVPDSFWDVLLGMVPQNVVEAAARFDLIGVIVFTVLFGIFLLTIDERKKAAMIGFVDAGAEVMMKMTRFIIALAPIGVTALIARMVASTGPEVFVDLFRYVLTVFSGLAFHLLVTLPLLLWVFTRRSPYRYLRVMSPALLTAFSTASSSGTLGVTMERAEKGAGISNRVTSFVLPLGATVNMDGTALYEVVTVLFLAQVHAAVHPEFQLTLGVQVTIVCLSLMVSVGAAGIPHAGLVMMVIILEAVGLPAAYTGIIWTVDRVLDMCRTSVNVAGDATIALIVAHRENEVGPPGAASSMEA
jgi:Na+/H+-dicarboxylate symporter